MASAFRYLIAAVHVADQPLVGHAAAARATAAASSGLAPGASRQYRFGTIALYPLTANVRAISLVCGS